MEWILTLSLVLLLVAGIVSVLEEWRKQGLTDTSYVTLLLWLAGQAGLVALAWQLNYLVLAVVLLLTIATTIYAIGLKVYDHRHYIRRPVPPQVKGKGLA
jgi:hypothetical protein